MPIDERRLVVVGDRAQPAPDAWCCENSSASAATMTPATAAAVTSNWLMSMPVLSITQLIGSSRMPRSRPRTSTPHSSCATPSMTKVRPIVAMNSVSALWFTSGRSTKRSVRHADKDHHGRP